MTFRLVLILACSASAAQAQYDGEDAEHRADRLRTEQLNQQALRATAPRVATKDQRNYDAARRRYEQQLVEWRKRVAACRGGDWSACR